MTSMKLQWPWVSRRAYDVLLDERDRLRAVNDQLTEHLTRMHRVEHGVAETPRAPKAKVEEMPKSLDDYFNGLGNPSMAKQLRREATSLHRAGEPWTSIQGRILVGIDADTQR